MRLRPAVLILFLFGLVPSLANALALGEITLNSGLNEALNAEIEVISATAEEIQNLTATVASRETFERYGLSRPDFLSGLRFQVARSGSRNVLRVATAQPISEPFVTFLVEAQWRRGRLLREYTVLLDPPVFLPTPETVVPAPIAAPRSVRSQTRPDSGQIVRDISPRPSSRTSQRRSSTPPAYGATYGPISRNETLWSVAERLRTDNSITMNQMMIAIYQANQGEFLGNINLMKEGSVLRIPDRATIERVAQPEAYAMAVAHNQAWRSGSPARVATTGTAPTRVSTTPDSSRLRLVEPDERASGSGSDVGAGRATAATDTAAIETLARNEADIARLSDENDQLRADLAEIRRLLNVRDGALAELQQQLGAKSTGPAITPDVTTPATTMATTATDSATAVATTDSSTDTSTATGGTDVGTDAATVAASTSGTDTTDTTTTDTATTDTAKPPVVTPPVVKSLPDEPGFIAKTIGWIKGAGLWLWLGLGVVALAAFGMFAMRGRESDGQDAIEALTREARESVPDTTIVPKLERPQQDSTSETAEVEFFDDSGTFKPVDFAAAQSAESVSGEYPFEDTVGGEIKLDQSDPLAEADFHMAYGLYDQASDLVKKAVAREPERIDLRMKLLEIFFVWGNENEFKSTAQDLRDNMSGEIAGEWDKIVIMGKQICPNDDLFAGDAAMGASADIDLEFEPTGTQDAVDLDTGLDADSGGGVDLDIGGALVGVPGADTGESAVGAFDTVNELLDFDIGDDEPLLDTDDETRPEPVEQIKDQIRARLSSTDTDETAEMDLSDLGVDLDLAGPGQPADADTESTAESDFGNVFDTPVPETDATSEFPAPTTELTAGGNALDLDIGDIFGSMDSGDDEETARDLASLEESMERTGSQVDDTGDTGHFSAEVETLHGDALDVDISSFNDDEASDTRLIAPEEATGTLPEDALANTIFGDFEQTGATPEDSFSDALFGDDEPAESDAAESDAAESDEETRLIGPDSTVGSHTEDAFSSAIFGEDETVQVATGDDFIAADDSGLDLDIGESLPENSDGTTAKVATSELALPGSDDELSEVGTKLDLARAYMDMGDPTGARGILEEVLAEGNEGQQADAREMLSSLG